VGEDQAIEIRAPGRICLFGEHQDYLGLPVIAAAINRFIRINAKPIEPPQFDVHLPDIGWQRELLLEPPWQSRGPRDYLTSSLRVLHRAGCRWSQGYDLTVTGDIPRQAGVSSSSAMVVAWIRFLLKVGADARLSDPGEVARFAHQAEVVEFDEPGGMMDHFASAYMGIVHVDTRPPFACRRLDTSLEGLILCYSGEPKATLDVLKHTRAAFSDALAALPGINVSETSIEEMQSAARVLPAAQRELLEAQWINRELTTQGLSAMESGCSPSFLGSLMTAEHEQLRRLGVSTDRIDTMLGAALATGAYGGKVNGSGGGGCLFVLAPGRQEAVIGAMTRVGGTAWPVEVVWES